MNLYNSFFKDMGELQCSPFSFDSYLRFEENIW